MLLISFGDHEMDIVLENAYKYMMKFECYRETYLWKFLKVFCSKQCDILKSNLYVVAFLQVTIRAS